MAGWFSRRSGSRVSIHNPVRRVLQAPSLSRNPMPPRTTRKSDRRKASDRTMVGTAQPLCLSASGTDRRRYDSTMNLRRRKNHSVSFHYWGWTARPFPLRFAVAEEAFVLTSPFIERGYRNVAREEPSPSGQDGASREISLLLARIRRYGKRTPRGQDRQSHGHNGKRRNVSQ
jgi:hypothetical protein